LWNVAPFAIGRIGKIAKLSKLAILKVIKTPKAIQLVRAGRYHVAVKLNSKLVERALDLRKTKFGVEFEDFRRTNVSVWHVSIDGKEQLFDAGKVPAGVLNKKYGKGDVDIDFHSEGLIAEELRLLERQGKQVKVHQIYTERVPCLSCGKLLEKYSESPVLHSLRAG
jgi:hypothetical protein